MKQSLLLLLSALLFACSGDQPAEEKAKARPNVLFIAIDDLRPELGCYGSEIAVTPNLDAIAAGGLLFERAYCQQAICSPSRASLMTGARPESTGIIENYTYFRDVLPDIVTLPQHFRANGYETVYSGKIYHGRFTDEEKSWSRKPAKPAVERPKYPGGYALKENQEAYLKNKEAMKKKYGDVYGLGMGPAYEKADVPDHHYGDGYNTEVAIATLREIVADDVDKPFFLGLGFHHPHLNWTSPARYWDMYDPAAIPLAELTDAPEGGAAMGLHASFELRVRDGVPDGGEIGPALSRTLKHAYLAAVSYVDAQIGKMIAALEETGMRENTIIIVWSDHGWHLGDMGVWGKATNYEIATRVPMMIWTPDMPAESRGKTSDALVELVDMYPTLAELAGLPLPGHLEGQSFAPLLENPGQKWKTAVFSQYPNPALREWAANPLNQGMRETYFGPLIEEVEERIQLQQGEVWNRDLFENHLMGYAMRTDQYRLVVWKDNRMPDAEPVFVELYDHQSDPGETRNVASEREAILAELMQRLDGGWKASTMEIKP